MNSVTPIVQTSEAVIVDTPFISLTVPGQWQQQPPTSSGCVYCGERENRLIILDGYSVTDELRLNDSMSAVNNLLERYLKTEREVTNGEVELHPERAILENNIAVATFFGLHSKAGRVVFCRLIGNDERVYAIYWEAFGFTSAPDLKALANEFLQIADSAKLK